MAEGNPEEGHGELYLTRLQGATATLNLKDGITIVDAPLHGEIVIEAVMEEELPQIIAVRRISLWTEPVEVAGGQISLGGPVQAPVFDAKPDEAGNLAAPLDLYVYYRRLGEQEPACREVDASYPPLEVLSGVLAVQVAAFEQPNLYVQLSIRLDTLTEKYDDLGILTGLMYLPGQPLQFVWMEPAGPPADITHRSLVECGAGAPGGGGHIPLKLKLKFITLSSTYTAAATLMRDLDTGAAIAGYTLENVIQEQINAACEVWWSKAGLKIVPEGAITSHPPGAAETFNRIELAAEECDVFGFDDVTDAVEVYLVDYLGSGGGVCHHCYTNDAFIILDINIARYNRYLLAHEIGHVIGLAHPSGSIGSDCSKKWDGNYCSLMLAGNPNSPRNTQHNIEVLNHTGPLAQVLTALGGACGWNPDADQNFYTLIRDFPADDGTQDSVPRPPASDWWTHSDVWNMQTAPTPATRLFNWDFSPRHEEPQRYADGTTLNNTMLVRVHTGQPLTTAAGVRANTAVHLFLANPGAAGPGLVRISPPQAALLPAGQTIYTSGIELKPTTQNFPTPEDPVIVMQSWSVPPLYPPNCCVFAVVVNDFEALNAAVPEDAALIDLITDANSAGATFYTLFSRLKKDNDLAQRNLHTQYVAAAAARLITRTHWVMADNPFSEPAPAVLEVDTSLAAGLESLTLEVEGLPPMEVSLQQGKPQRFELAAALAPGERRIVRLRAGLPPGPAQGASFPLSLGIFMNDIQVSGYRHVVRVGTRRQATLQVLDWLYAALEDVGLACRQPPAKEIARSVRLTLVREARGIRPLSGCLVWFFRLFGFRTTEWDLELSRLAEKLTRLAERLLAGDRGPECREIGGHVQKLAGLLRAPRAMDPADFLERLRELADTIQQRAGQLGLR